MADQPPSTAATLKEMREHLSAAPSNRSPAYNFPTLASTNTPSIGSHDRLCYSCDRLRLETSCDGAPCSNCRARQFRCVPLQGSMVSQPMVSETTSRRPDAVKRVYFPSLHKTTLFRKSRRQRSSSRGSDSSTGSQVSGGSISGVESVLQEITALITELEKRLQPSMASIWPLRHSSSSSARKECKYALTTLKAQVDRCVIKYKDVKQDTCQLIPIVKPIFPSDVG